MKKLLIIMTVVVALFATSIPSNASWYIIQERSNPINWGTAGGGN